MHTAASAFRLSLLIAGATLLARCGPSDVRVRAAVRDSAGVRIVESAESVWADGEGWRIAAEPTLVIGAVDGPDEIRFHRIAGVVRLDDGRIVVANGGTGELRFYGSDGTHLRSVGGSGQGPGEFRSMSEPAVFGDSLFVYDRSLQRLSVFDLAGGYLGSVRLGPTDDAIYTTGDYNLAGILARGAVMRPFAFDAASKPVPTVYWDSAANLVYGFDGMLRDTIGSFSGMDMYGDPEVGTDIELGGYTVLDAHGGRLYQCHSDEYEIEVHGPGGLERRIRRLESPPAVTESMIAEQLESMLGRAPSEEVRRELRRLHQEDVDKGRFAKTLPTCTNLVVDATDNVWVERYRLPWRDEPRLWDVFDAEGRWLGSVEMPAALTVHQIGEDLVLGVIRDELGVERVAVCPILGRG